MSRTIWKWTLHPRVTLDMPDGARVLGVGVQGDDIVLWALVDKTTRPMPRTFRVFGTGHPVDGAIVPEDHVGTVQFPDGLVFHVFEEREP